MPHVRCRACRARRTLTRNPEEYYRIPPCRRCGKRNWGLDTYRSKHERGSKPRTGRCYPGRDSCGGYHFPHRKGSGFCDHNPNVTLEDRQARWEGG